MKFDVNNDGIGKVIGAIIVDAGIGSEELVKKMQKQKQDKVKVPIRNGKIIIDGVASFEGIDFTIDGVPKIQIQDEIKQKFNKITVAFELMGENMQKQKQDKVAHKINEIVDIIESDKIEELKGKNKRAGKKISELQARVVDLEIHLNAVIGERKPQYDEPKYRFEGTLNEISKAVADAKNQQLQRAVGL